MKKLIIVIFILLLLPSLVFAQSAKDAARALKKLEARCQAGISYKDYSPALGDAKFEVNMFMGTQEAKQKTELASFIQKAMRHYESARTAWSMKFSGYGKPQDVIDLDSKEANGILSVYPEANKSYDNGGVIIEANYMFGKVKKLFIPAMVHFIWKEASKELDKAMELLTHQENSSTSLPLHLQQYARSAVL